LKIQSVAQIKYVEEEDLMSLGLTKPEIRRLRKYFEKYYPKTYLNRIKKVRSSSLFVKLSDKFSDDFTEK